MRISVSAPGKLILHGEHAVVHGKTAIAAALGLRTSVTVSQCASDAPAITLNLKTLHNSPIHWSLADLAACAPLQSVANTPQLPDTEHMLIIEQLAAAQNDNATIRSALIALAHLLASIYYAGNDQSQQSLTIDVASSLPVGAGLGSSAAFSVAIAGAFLVASGTIPPTHDEWSHADRTLVNDWAFQGEKLIHGNPSGVDNAVACFGGTISFKGGVISEIADMPQLRILLVNTSVPRSTKALVAGVGRLATHLPTVIEPVLAAMDAISTNSVATLRRLHAAQSTSHPDSDTINTLGRCYADMSQLIDVNQALLDAIGVGHRALSRVVQLARDASLSAKLTGAGGGGCAFVLLAPSTTDEQVTKLRARLEAESFQCFHTVIGDHGVHLDSFEA